MKLRSEKNVDDHLEMNADYAEKSTVKLVDHAMGLKVDGNAVTCFNNGYTPGFSEYSVYKVATQIANLVDCYVLNLQKRV